MSTVHPPEGPPVASASRGPSAAATATPSLDKLSRTLQRGAKISAIVLVVTQSISLIQTLAVARLLSPAEVGAFTAGSILTNFLVTFTEAGLRAALIQREENVEDAADTVFWATLVNGLIMSGLAFAASPLIGAFFGGDVAGAVCAATAAVLTIHALTNVPDGLMQRRFNFKRRMIVNPSTAVSFAAVSITLSALGYGVWGLVIALYTSQIVTLVLTWWLAGWRPGRGRFDVRLWREMARFAFPLIASEFAQKGREFMEAGFTGRLLGQGALGMYRYGRRIAALPGTAIVQIASYVLFPAFSRIAKDPTRLRRGFLRATTSLWVTALPAGALLVVVGEPLVVVALGEQWRGAGLVLMGMAGYGPGMALAAIGKESIKGAGRSRLLNWVTGTSLVVSISALLLLIGPLGLLGVGMAASIESLVAGSLAIALCLRIVGVRPGQLLGVFLPVLVAGLGAMAATFVLEHRFFGSDERALPVGIGLLLVDLLVFVGVYLILLRLLAPDTSRELLAGVRSVLGGGRGRRRPGTAAARPDPDAAHDHPTQALPAARGTVSALDAPTVLIPTGAGTEYAPRWAVAVTERLGVVPPARGTPAEPSDPDAEPSGATGIGIEAPESPPHGARAVPMRVLRRRDDGS